MTDQADMPESRDIQILRGGWGEDWWLSRWSGLIGPRNTWSNLAYAAVGTALAVRFQDSASAAMAVALWVLATGSALYHGAKTIWANRLDWVGMYAVMGALAAHAIAPAWSWLMLVVAGGLGFVYARYYRWGSFDWHMGALLLLATVPPLFFRRVDLVAMGLGWACFVLAKIAWALDRKKSLPLGLWGHVIWHLLTAAAIGLVYMGAA